jgi:hypothetical protein
MVYLTGVASRCRASSLDLDEFINEMGQMMAGPTASRERLTLMFRRMDANMDNQVEWNEFSDFMLLEGLANDKRDAANAMYIAQDRSARPEVKQHSGTIRRIKYSPQLGKYFSSGTDSTIRVWDQTLQHQKTVNTGGWVHDFTIWMDGGQLAAATTRAITVFDLTTMDKIDVFDVADWAPLCMGERSTFARLFRVGTASSCVACESYRLAVGCSQQTASWPKKSRGRHTMPLVTMVARCTC